MRVIAKIIKWILFLAIIAAIVLIVMAVNGYIAI